MPSALLGTPKFALHPLVRYPSVMQISIVEKALEKILVAQGNPIILQSFVHGI